MCFRLTVNVIWIPYLVSSRIWTFGGLVGQMVGIPKDCWMDFDLGGDKESIKGEAGEVAVGEGTYSTQFFWIENNNSADQAVPNALSVVVISFGGALALISTSKALSQIR